MAERELIRPVVLTDFRGRLNPAAVGWARRPLVDTSGIGTRHGWGRNKRWEYWNITTPTHIIALTVSSLDYAAVHEIWVLDRQTQQTWGKAATVLPARGASLPASLGDGPARARAKDLQIDIYDNGHTAMLSARTIDVDIDITAIRPPDHDCLAVVVPWSSERFQYTVKDIALDASGVIHIDGHEYPVPAGQSWAVLDHGRGRWPYDIQWNWGAGSGISDGHTIGIQVGGKWTYGTGSTENGILIDGHLHKISEELTWDYDLKNWQRDWHIHGGGLDATLTPFYNRTASTNLLLLSSDTTQCFGHWSGTYTTKTTTTTFTNILGWAESVHNRW